MRILTLALAALIAAGQLPAGPTAAQAQEMVVTPAVMQAFAKYRQLVMSGKPGTFVVTGDGVGYVYYHCPERRCRDEDQMRRKALSQCGALSGADCVVFAVNRDIKVAYRVAGE
jgi:hypothetical protein